MICHRVNRQTFARLGFSQHAIIQLRHAVPGRTATLGQLSSLIPREYLIIFWRVAAGSGLTDPSRLGVKLDAAEERRFECLA
jgi:hypothetical protein